MATIDDLVPIASTSIAPRLRTEGGVVILVVVTADGRLHRLALTPSQFGGLAGDVAAAILKHQPSH